MTGDPCRVILVRAGQAALLDEHGPNYDDGNASLTSRGREQAARLGAALDAVPLDAVYCSDLVRAHEFAKLATGHRNLPTCADPRFREVDIGALEGTPTGESLAAGLARVLPLFLEIVRAHPGGAVLIVSHSWIVQLLVSYVIEAGSQNAHRFRSAEAALTMLEVGLDGRGVLYALNALDDARGFERIDAARSTTRVFFVRHGHAMSVETGGQVFSHHPTPLTALGREQAQQVGTVLRSAHVDAIYASNLERAKETAELCSRALGVGVVLDETLREVGLGDFEGTTLKQIHAEHPRFAPWLEVTFKSRFPSVGFHHPADESFPNGESVLEVHERALAGFLRIVQAEQGRTILIVSHGWVLQPLLCHVVGSDPRAYFRFSLPNAIVSLAEVGADGCGVLAAFNAGVDLAALPKLTAFAGADSP